MLSLSIVTSEALLIDALFAPNRESDTFAQNNSMSQVQKMINAYTLLITRKKPIQKPSNNYLHLMTHSLEFVLHLLRPAGRRRLSI